MKHLCCCVVLIHLIQSVILQNNNNLIDEGETCELSSKEKGICTRLSDCSTANKLFEQSKIPENCGFIGDMPIICCPQKPRKNTRKVEKKCMYVELSRFDFIGDSSTKSVNSHRINIPEQNKISKNIFMFPSEDTFKGEDVVQRFSDHQDISDLRLTRATSNYVLGGQDAKIREFPHMAALGYNYTNEIIWLCRGSLISDQYILTAAHCLKSLDYGPVEWIRLGDINRDATSQADNQDFRVEKTISHPLYRPSSTYHDIALVKISGKALINSFVNTACLYMEDQIPPSQELWATGWGLTMEGGNQSDILQKVELDLFSEEKCDNVYKATKQLENGILHKQQICAGGRVNQKDTCQGDSGGPLQIRKSRSDEDVFYIVGVTSFGKQCGNKDSPGVYTRVSFYIPWIENIIWPDVQ